MTQGDKLVIVLLLVGVSIVLYAHYDAKSDCLSMEKPETDSTPFKVVTPFTGEYKRISGHLFCKDSRGNLYRHPDSMKVTK